MARLTAIILLALTGIMTLPGAPTSETQLAVEEHSPASSRGHMDQPGLTASQQGLVDRATDRFGIQGLQLPEIKIIFHDDLRVCRGHKGMFHRSTQTLEMCSLDLHTMLHELAHAWANESLTVGAREAFVSSRGLASWNDHDDPWDRRGTEHVAETIAWGLADDPHHVKWVETLADGSQRTTHRVLTIGVDVETLLTNFRSLTGADPVFRDPSEWSDVVAPIESPEVARARR